MRNAVAATSPMATGTSTSGPAEITCATSDDQPELTRLREVFCHAGVVGCFRRLPGAEKCLDLSAPRHRVLVTQAQQRAAKRTLEQHIAREVAAAPAHRSDPS